MLIGHEKTNENMKIKRVLIVAALGLSVCLSASLKETKDGDFEERERSGKSLGLHSSIGQNPSISILYQLLECFPDGSSFMWVNTSAVSTAGFFGNAAVLLAGVYLLRKVNYKDINLLNIVELIGAVNDHVTGVGQKVLL